MPRPSGLVTACTMREMRCSVPAHGRTVVKRPRAARGAGDGAVQRAWDACAARVLWVKVPWGRGGRLQVPWGRGCLCGARPCPYRGRAARRRRGGPPVHERGGGCCLARSVSRRRRLSRPSCAVSSPFRLSIHREDAREREKRRLHELVRDCPISPEITRDHPRLPEIAREKRRLHELVRAHGEVLAPLRARGRLEDELEPAAHLEEGSEKLRLLGLRPTRGSEARSYHEVDLLEVVALLPLLLDCKLNRLPHRAGGDLLEEEADVLLTSDAGVKGRCSHAAVRARKGGLLVEGLLVRR